MKKRNRKKRLRLSMENWTTSMTAKMSKGSNEDVELTIHADKHSVSVKMGISRFIRLIQELRLNVKEMSKFMRQQEDDHRWKANMLESSIVQKE